MAKAVINGNVHEFEPGVSILKVCRAPGVDIPALCHDERLKPIGGCRMCLVEIERKPHPVTACNNLLMDGMVIETHTSALEYERRMLLKMLAQDHPADGLHNTPEKPFYRYARAYGLSESDFTGSSEPHLLDDSHPYIHVDMSQTMTMRTANVKLRPANVLDISSDDAKRLKLHEGERVQIRSRYGEATLPIRITSTVKPGELFATFHTAEVFLNRVTSPHRDRYVKSPEYKVTAVKIERVNQER